MKKEQLYISTIASDDAETAGQYGLGLEIAEFCTAWQIDNEFTGTDAAVRQKLRGIPRRLLHGPFNELFPCAIDPKARELAKERYRQALSLTRDYGCTKLILHGGFHPKLYYPCWYVEQSTLFWREFLAEDPVPKALLTVYETSGSTPVKSGAMMAVGRDLRTAGTIGGGCSEDALRREALRLIGTGDCRCVTVDMSQDVAEEEGMVCGGVVSVLLERVK